MLICPYCQAERIYNEAPCHNCGAPSPLLGQSPSLRDNAPSYSAPWGTFGSSVSGQQSSSQEPQYTPPSERQPDQSLLPVPYQGNTQLQPLPGQNSSVMHLVPAELLEHMLPALPDVPEPIHVPPMYTKPRPSIPRYRAISGLISFVVVCLLLCTGAGYAAKANGLLDSFGRFITDAPPPGIQRSTNVQLADPKTTPDKGPAASVITSAVTTTEIDPTTNLGRVEQHQFTTNQTIYVAYTVKTQQKGILRILWYSNQNVYSQAEVMVEPKPGFVSQGAANMSYTFPTNGAVELDWNGQLGQKLYFVVKTA